MLELNLLTKCLHHDRMSAERLQNLDLSVLSCIISLLHFAAICTCISFDSLPDIAVINNLEKRILQK